VYETIVVKKTHIKYEKKTFEMAFFLKIPHGHGIYDAIISFNQLLKYTMITLFHLLPYTNHTYLCVIYVKHYNSLNKPQKHALKII